MNRRQFIEVAVASSLSTLTPRASWADAKSGVINDVSQLNPVLVADERRPRSTEEVRKELRAWTGLVSVGGGRYSMGGQTAAVDSLHLDMRALNKVVFFDPQNHVIRVQAGIVWRDLQDIIDPHDLSVKIMQSFSNFTVGGSVSVNCHGRYVGKGPIVNSVRAVQMVTRNGDVLELTRTSESEIFRAVFGGYGGLGVITEVELDLETNSRIERFVKDIALDDYPKYFRGTILSGPRVIMHNANLSPPNFNSPRSISWKITSKKLTNTNRLIPRNLDYNLEKNAIWAISELPGGNKLRKSLIDRELLHKQAVVLRNHEASMDANSLEPRTRNISTYLL